MAAVAGAGVFAVDGTDDVDANVTVGAVGSSGGTRMPW